MNSDHLDQVLADFETLRDPDADPELEAVKAAILFEDVFGITLSDDEIEPAMLSGAGLDSIVTRIRNAAL